MENTVKEKKQPKLRYGRLLRKLASEGQWIEDVDDRPVHKGDLEKYGVILINRLDQFVQYTQQHELTFCYSENSEYVQCILTGLKPPLESHRQYPILFQVESPSLQAEMAATDDRIYWAKENLLKNFTSAQAILMSDEVICWILSQRM